MYLSLTGRDNMSLAAQDTYVTTIVALNRFPGIQFQLVLDPGFGGSSSTNLSPLKPSTLGQPNTGNPVTARNNMSDDDYHSNSIFCDQDSFCVLNPTASSLILSNVISTMNVLERFQRRSFVLMDCCSRHPTPITSFVTTLSMLIVELESMSVSWIDKTQKTNDLRMKFLQRNLNLV